MSEVFKERHKGESLPPMERTATEKKQILPLIPSAAVIPITFAGEVRFVTEQEALGIIGQVISVLQTRISGGCCYGG
jgi:hypothetical protein